MPKPHFLKYELKLKGGGLLDGSMRTYRLAVSPVHSIFL